MRIPRVIFTWWSTKRSSIAREQWRLTGRQVSVRPWQQQTWVSTIPCCRSGFRTALSILKLQVLEGDGGNKRISHKGKLSQVAKMHDELLDWVEEYRVNDFSFSKKMLVFQATQLLPPGSPFPLKLLAARTQVISCWMAKYRLTICAGTHEVQEDPQVTASEALDFILHIAWLSVDPSLRHCDKRFIIIMDQTPVFFSMHATKTVTIVDQKTIHIRTLMNLYIAGKLLLSLTNLSNLNRSARYKTRGYLASHTYICRKLYYR